MTPILDHSFWAVRPEVMAAVQRLVSGDVPRSDLERLLGEDPQAAEARVRAAQGGVDSADIPRVGSVAMLQLCGLIQPSSSLLSLLLFGYGGSLQRFRAELRAALEDDSIEAIILHVDSPGGRTSLVEETAAELRAARDVKPIVAVANTMACSAAYHIASQATELVVTPSGYVGSIGVYMLHTDLSGALEQEGVTMTYVYAGRFKVEGNPYEPLSDAAREDWQRDVDGIHARFIRDVAVGRGTDENNVAKNFGEGRVLTAPDALRVGMVDRVATFEAALDTLRQSVDQAPPGGSTSARRAEDPAAPADPGALDPERTAEDPADEGSRLTAADDFDALVA